jgi:hypothetical protein
VGLRKLAGRPLVSHTEHDFPEVVRA